MQDGKLREDLYYRLNVFAIALPPLRDRAEDLPLLVQASSTSSTSGTAESSGRVDEAPSTFSSAIAWPGNVRELRNVIERAVISARGDLIEPRHLPPARRGHGAGRRGAADADWRSRRHDRRGGRAAADPVTLEHTGDNKTRAAEILGISLKTLHNKLHKYNA